MRSSFPLVTAVMTSRMVDAALDTRAIDSSLLASFELMAQYASAGYCNVAGTIGSVVSCEENTCDDLVANGVTIMATLESGWEATGGVVLKDDVNQAIVVSFSGTAVLDDWVLNLNFGLESTDLCDDCEVHSGFQGAWKAMEETVVDTVTTLVAQNPTYNVSFTGHSLGGSVATFGCAYWRKEHNGTCELYTFGSPRVGNEEFALFVSAQPGDEYRITHIKDPVPRLPPHTLGYRHTDMEYWLSTGTSMTVDYTVDDVVVCTGTYNNDCNGSGWWNTDIKAHSYYFNHIAVCT